MTPEEIEFDRSQLKRQIRISMEDIENQFAMLRTRLEDDMIFESDLPGHAMIELACQWGQLVQFNKMYGVK
jgi:hypothetical protein